MNAAKTIERPHGCGAGAVVVDPGPVEDGVEMGADHDDLVVGALPRLGDHVVRLGTVARHIGSKLDPGSLRRRQLHADLISHRQDRDGDAVRGEERRPE